MTATVRGLARSTWVGVGAKGPDQGLRAEKGAENAGFGMGAGRRKDQEKEQGKRRRKEEALRLMVAFVVSVKHHLRGEFGVGYEGESLLVMLMPAPYAPAYEISSGKTTEAISIRSQISPRSSPPAYSSNTVRAGSMMVRCFSAASHSFSAFPCTRLNSQLT